MSQPEFPQSSLRVLFFFVFFCFFFVFFCFFFVVSCFFVFFVFLLNCAKSFLVELWADKRMQKVDLGGGEHIYIYVYIHYICIQTCSIYKQSAANDWSKIQGEYDRCWCSTLWCCRTSLGDFHCITGVQSKGGTNGVRLRTCLWESMIYEICVRNVWNTSSS